jgi:group I intron endonuclease
MLTISLLPSSVNNQKLSTGIYCIINVKNGHKYIGSTVVNLKRRLFKHYNLLLNNRHFSKHLQNAWNLYGEHSFTFNILEYVHPNDCLLREQFYIDQENFENLYNTVRLVSRGPALQGEKNGMYGKKHTQQSLEKMSKNRKGKLLGQDNPCYLLKGEKHPASKQVIDLKSGRVFGSLKLAAEYFNVNPTTFSSWLTTHPSRNRTSCIFLRNLATNYGAKTNAYQSKEAI